ncbi:hypothetical protein [Desulfobulbus elongatus]|uniref:hypothetical protein n=1 Tax=Desulfobulbus elongatus TaxID=53332 RepID=UPI00047F4816|nr:hypothetical protein [Desulfobulbus elongatus]
MDDFEDLTLFANESFDTGNVDLFEFTSEESSPLTRLKSIILSLDWEISDDILQELEEELDNLQTMWQGDKVAEVYLQGLSKIGRYIRTKGAYAHPNSIKLLLTFFYNFEKIISSAQITGEQITQLLKGDVRKFKILQYQINQSESTPAEPAGISVDPEESAIPPDQAGAVTEQDAFKQLRAAILSLDWEVTDDSLRQFNEKIDGVHTRIAGNKPALVLVQGLQVLGDYIADERAESHPESFILLHSFNEALEEVTKTGDQQLEQEHIQDLLVDRINRLNNLKMLIASPTAAGIDDQKLDQVFEELSAPVAGEASGDVPSLSVVPGLAADVPEAVPPPDTLAASTEDLAAELDTLFATEAIPAMESADVHYPDEVLPPEAIHPVDDELADDFIESSLSSKRGLTPALADANETSGFDASAEPLDLPTQSDLAEQLDFLFADTGTEEESLADLAGNEIGADPVIAALSDAEIPGEDNAFVLELQETEEIDAGSLDIQSKLDSFFAGDDDEPEESGDALTEDATGDDPVIAALSDAEIPGEDNAFVLELQETEEIDAGSLDIQSKLDSFFAEDGNEPLKPGTASETKVNEIEQTLFFNETESLQAALADSDEEQGFSEEAEIAALSFTPMDEIEEKLGLFFGTDEEIEEETLPAESGQATPAESLGPDPTATGDVEFETAPTTTEPDAWQPGGETTLSGNRAGREPEHVEAFDLGLTGTEEEEQAAPAPPEVDALTMALEATIADQPPAPPATVESAEIQLAALGALLPLVVRTPSRDNVAESTGMVATLKQGDLSPVQQSLVQLLESTLTLLVRLPTKEHAATERLVNYLYEQLIAEHGRADVLPEAIGRFTVWLHEAGRIMPIVPAASGQEHEPHYAYTAKELYFELSDLRASMREEFAKLRHEMEHHR